MKHIQHKAFFYDEAFFAKLVDKLKSLTTFVKKATTLQAASLSILKPSKKF